MSQRFLIDLLKSLKSIVLYVSDHDGISVNIRESIFSGSMHRSLWINQLLRKATSEVVLWAHSNPINSNMGKIIPFKSTIG